MSESELRTAAKLILGGQDDVVITRVLGGPRPAWRLVYDADPYPDIGYPMWCLQFPGCEQALGYDLPTRGDVRRLCEALGIPLEERK